MYWQYRFTLSNRSSQIPNRYYAYEVYTDKDEALAQCDKLRAMINRVRK